MSYESSQHANMSCDVAILAEVFRALQALRLTLPSLLRASDHAVGPGFDLDPYMRRLLIRAVYPRPPLQVLQHGSKAVRNVL